MHNYGKLTVRGSIDFEEKLSLVLNNIKEDIEKSVSSKLYEAIFLIGGYGRGEGGVLKVNNIEKPHNNFDFVIVAKDIPKKDLQYLENTCKEIFDLHSIKQGLFVEFTTLSVNKLNNMDPLLITYDMKYGHKLILGKSDILTNNKRFEVESIPSWDIRNLIVNRGTLLLINDLILNKNEIVEKDRKIIIKHWVKAIIGYGDALLYYLGKYDYSYVEKKKRMQNETNVNKRFKSLYEKAMNFRFSPNYEIYDDLDLKRVQKLLKNELYKIHNQCESLNNVSLESNLYISSTVSETLDSDRSIKGQIKKIYYLTKSAPSLKSISFLENIKYKMIGIKGMMPILFPFIVYGSKSNQVNKILNDFFKINEGDECLKLRYLSYWKTYVNSNFVKSDFGI